MKSILHIIFMFLCLPVFSQDTINIVNDIFMVKYSEELEQPLFIYYVVKCNNGDISRSGMDFRLHEGIHTSDNDDYKNQQYEVQDSYDTLLVIFISTSYMKKHTH